MIADLSPSCPESLPSGIVADNAMSDLYFYSLIPVIAVSLLLFFSTILYGSSTRGLAAFCLAVAAWGVALGLAASHATGQLGHRLVAIGAFVPAGFLHAIHNITASRKAGFVLAAYGLAAAIAAVGGIYPHLLHEPDTLRVGPLFWPAIAVAAVGAGVPAIVVGLRIRTDAGQRKDFFALAGAGLLGFGGAAFHTLSATGGYENPFGLFVVLGSMFLLAGVVRRRQSAKTKRIIERSLTYSVLAAFISAGFLFGVLTILQQGEQQLTTGYGISALFLLFLAALAFEPLRVHLLELITKRISHKTSNVSELADALVEQEQRANQATRLAELGTFTSAVAHEVRNPLGVISAQLKIMEKQDNNPEALASMREQIARAERFVEDLLRYGRPRPLEIRSVDLNALVELSYSTALGARQEPRPRVELELSKVESVVFAEVDQAQIMDALVVLFDNALLELGAKDGARIRTNISEEDERAVIIVEDNGSGIAPEVRDRLFEPFVTSRKRGGNKGGTGLGLAIARGIVERHGGSLVATTSELGGARFDLELPLIQKVMGAAKGTM